ncbi:hypothetical protein [Thiohalobacter thiocyanaticus]|uniref:hypothetical protein n=1 Tax=Thiohalobacter thiocyanaticus TaxID=585455 RepID=UPI000F6383BD|nr:hypothetical protein [Thiohalobacter thiocyanaticus]
MSSLLIALAPFLAQRNDLPEIQKNDNEFFKIFYGGIKMINKQTLVFLLLLPWSICLAANNDSFHQNGSVGFFNMDGDLWNRSNKVVKTFYLSGLYDGMFFSELDVNGTTITTQLRLDNMVTALDEFYSDYRNAKLPVPVALIIVTKELQGRPAEEIDETSRQMRKHFSQ